VFEPNKNDPRSRDTRPRRDRLSDAWKLDSTSRYHLRSRSSPRTRCATCWPSAPAHTIGRSFSWHITMACAPPKRRCCNWGAGQDCESEMALSFAAPCDRSASARRGCRCGLCAGSIGTREYPGHNDLHALDPDDAGRPDMAAVWQSLGGANTPVVSYLPPDFNAL
jgi:hypothetical protein